MTGLDLRCDFDSRALMSGLRRLGTRGNRVAARAAKRLAKDVQGTERMLLRAKRHRRGTPTPSNPGEPPARVTGHLARSVMVMGPVAGGNGFSITVVGPTASYGAIHEVGGVTGRGHRTVLPPRPHLKPAWRLVRPRHMGIIRSEWGRGR